MREPSLDLLFNPKKGGRRNGFMPFWRACVKVNATDMAGIWTQVVSYPFDIKKRRYTNILQKIPFCSFSNGIKIFKTLSEGIAYF